MTNVTTIEIFYLVNVIAKIMATAMAAIKIMISMQQIIFLDRF